MVAKPFVGALSYFPTPLEDELLYSAVARYHYAVGAARGTATKRRLFGTFSLPTALPGNLEHFAAQLPPGTIDVRQVIERHTNFPYFAPFLSTEYGRRTLVRMREQDGLAVKLGLGLVGSQIKDVRFLRQCRLCVLEQRNTGGQPYWRRIHQLPGVATCPIHDEPLIDRCPQCGPFDHRHAALILPEERCRQCGHAYTAPPPTADAALGIAQAKFATLSREALLANLPTPPPRVRPAVYADAFAALGIKSKKSTLSGEISARVRAHWGAAFLKHLGLEDGPTFALPRGLLHEIEATTHPVFHLLVIGMLFGTIGLWAAKLGSNNVPADSPSASPQASASDLSSLLRAHRQDIAFLAAARGVTVWALGAEAWKQGIALGRLFGHRDPQREMLMTSGLASAAPIPEIAAVAAVSVETVYRRLKASSELQAERAKAVAHLRLDPHKPVV